MKKTQIYSQFVLVLLILSASVSCTKPSDSNGKNSSAPVTSPSPSAETKQQSVSQASKEVWTCPMHPQVRQDKPGQCPICGMNLIKAEPKAAEKTEEIKLDHPDEHAAIQLSPARQQMIGVKIGIAQKKNLFKNIRAAGRLAFDPELYTAQNEYAEALRQLERTKDSPLPDVSHSAERMIQSAKLRLKILGLSDKQISRIGTADHSESDLLLTKPGQQAWIYAEIFEMDLPYVQPGQTAEMSASFLGGKTLAGKIISVDRVINPATRTAKARILISEGSTYLRPESYVDVTIHAPLGELIAVPFDAVMDTGKESWVFTVDENGQFTPQLVTIKLHAGDEVAIAKGLKGGERIVTSANFLIDSESRLKGVGLSSNSTTEVKDETKKPSLPSCPKNQHWDVPMAMCMPD